MDFHRCRYKADTKDCRMKGGVIGACIGANVLLLVISLRYLFQEIKTFTLVHVVLFELDLEGYINF